jgi:hypothetical protein
MSDLLTARGDDTVIALVDVTSMYVSCERVFDPSLEGRPSKQASFAH